MAVLRSVHLRVSLGPSAGHYALSVREDRDGRLRDGRLSFGSLPHLARSDDPHNVLIALRRALEDLEARHGRPSGEAAPGAPGGGGGRSGRPEGRFADDGPFSRAGQHLDVPLPGL